MDLLLSIWSSVSEPKIWLPLMISSFAFFVSASTWWRTRVAPFTLRVRSGGRVEVSYDPNCCPFQPLITLPLLFSNTGAKLGYVSDLALIGYGFHPNNFPVLFRSKFEITDSQINFSTDMSTPPKVVPFESFEIKGGETVLKKVSFNLSDSIDNFRYAESAYKITLFASAMPETRGWLVGETLSFSITADDLTGFDKSRMKKLPNGTLDAFIVSQSKPTSELDKNIGMLTALLKGHGSINAFQLNSRAIKFLCSNRFTK